MRLHHLNRVQNSELARLLIAVAKALGIAAIVALIFPPGGVAWPIIDLVGGGAIAMLLAILGISILGEVESEETSGPDHRVKRRRR